MGFGRFGAIAAALLLAGFSPAQAERSAASAALGAENHPQILARFGGEVPDSTLRDYVARVAGNSRWQLLLHGPCGGELPIESL